MPDITRERQGEIVRKVFEILLRHPDGLPAKETLASAAGELTLSPFEASDYPNRPGVRRFEKIVRFSTIPFVKAGWMMKSKGTWVVTDEGRAAYEAHPDPGDFMRAAVTLYQAWRRSQPDELTPDSAEVSDQEDIAATTTLEEAEEAAWSDISAHLRSLDPYEFQELVAGLLEAMGYHVSWIAPPGPDRGIDIVAGLDPLGIKDPRIKVQVAESEARTQERPPDHVDRPRAPC